MAQAQEAGCPLFPTNNALNQDISKAPVDPDSARYIESIGASGHLHASFGAEPIYGMPYSVAGPQQPKVPVRFTLSPQSSDPGPYPIPPNAPIQGEGTGPGDHHLLVLQSGTCKLYELYLARRQGSGWEAGSGAVFNLRSNALRPDGWGSADAAGLPIFPLLARYQEVRAGAIEHALRVTVRRTQRGFIHPATHFSSSSTDPSLPPMGLRLRLKASFDTSGYHGQALIVLRALKRYGLIVADEGDAWDIGGATNPGWNDRDLHQLETVPGSALEAVSTGPILHGGSRRRAGRRR
ncbi:MAG TPA: hypothetical protein VGX69_01270 [Solirubrobacteraceae bacterium]|nr:hypothetical protein [Solirubrobacteraceae bacterium]